MNGLRPADKMLAIASGVACLAWVVAGSNNAPPQAVALNANNWLGIDGNWSTVQFQVGSPAQTVDVLVSTAISEFWVVGPGGCELKDPICSAARGYIFSPSQSTSWSPLGLWQLGLSYLNMSGAGDYGLETISMLSNITGNALAMNGVITAAINTTNYYEGMFGLGITQGSFGTTIADSPLTQAVEEYGWIPSYSFGYTAGAYYKNGGMPSSVTLGGYDESRFINHQTTFNLDQEDGSSPVLVRGIQVSAAPGKSPPTSWNSSTQILSTMNNSFSALVDSSTPFLWLPDSVCDAFADALGLTYNSTFDLYTITDSQFDNLDSFVFTFALSSYDNHDTYGGPLATPGVVNITISGPAFGQLLRYPYQQLIPYGAPAVPYFPLRPLQNSTYAIIGRAFLQEAYMIMQYDSGIFSIHQALFPDDPIKDAELTTIQRPPGSPFPAAPPYTRTATGLSTAQMASIGAGVFALCVAILGLLWWFCWRKRKAKRRAAGAVAVEDPDKDGSSLAMADTPKPVSRIISKIVRRKRSRKPGSSKGSGTDSNLAEVGAEGHELYELPVPIGPVELDAVSDHNSLHGDTELGSEGTGRLSAYEIARRKMERQLQGPVPAYTPPASGSGPLPSEKAIQDVSPVATYRPGDTSPVSPFATFDNSGNSLPTSLPSPTSPHGDWTNRIPDLPSPLTVAPPFPSPLYAGSSSGPSTLPPNTNQTFDPSSISRSNSSNGVSPSSPVGSLAGSLAGSMVPPSPVYQRTPIDSSRVVCLGPLPENIQLPSQPSIPRLGGTTSRGIPTSTLSTLPTMNPNANHSTDTLGSNYTEVEERIAEEMTRQASLSQGQNQSQSHSSPPHSPRHRGELATPKSQERIDAGSELIHVPQPAEKRYSWEE